jgi:hypothetical protein
MPDYFRAVDRDYDGTITTEPRPAALMLAAIRELRSANRRIVPVTGRIVGELLVDFPDACEHFDAVVAENGAVLWREGRAHSAEHPQTCHDADEDEGHEQGLAQPRGDLGVAGQCHGARTSSETGRAARVPLQDMVRHCAGI